MLKSSDRSAQQEYYYNLLQHWISKYAFAVWGGMCAIAIALCTYGAIDLLSAGPIEPDPAQAEPTTVRETPTKNPPPETPIAIEPLLPEPEPGLPLAVIIFLLIACGTGTLVATYVFKSLSEPETVSRSFPHRKAARTEKSAKRSRSKSKPRKNYPPARVKRPRANVPTLQSQPSTSARKSPIPPQLTAFPRTRAASVSLALSRPPVSRQVGTAIAPPPPANATVTIVPPEEVVALDRRKPSLAEMLDLRNRHTLTAFVQGEKV